MTTDSDKLQAAIAALGAVEVAPGITAYKIPGGGWATVASQVFEREASRGLENMEFSGQEVLAVLPSWWTPERRFAWRIMYDGGFEVDNRRFATKAEAREGTANYTQAYATGFSLQRITADLETGAEVPA